jgi:hypothetical protein
MRHEFSRQTKREALRRAGAGEARAWVAAALASDTDECLLWPFAKLRNGYGQFNSNGHSVRLHRHICILVHGEPPSPKHEAAHSCGTRACGNPKHIRWATPKENHADQIAHGTINRGHRHGHVKLTKEIVLVARASSETAAALAKRYGVATATMQDAIRRRTWAWL